MKISEKTIERFSVYRRVLAQFSDDGRERFHSAELAARAGCSAVQVRRDLMVINYYGNPTRGYSTPELIAALDAFLDHPEGTRVVLVGLGNLGRAVVDYFRRRRTKLEIIAAFDNIAERVNREYRGTPCRPMEKLASTIRDQNVRVGIICVPASGAQQVAADLVGSGITGILNFAPVRLEVPDNVYLEDVDLAMSLEKVAFFSRPHADDESSNHSEVAEET